MRGHRRGVGRRTCCAVVACGRGGQQPVPAGVPAVVYHDEHAEERQQDCTPGACAEHARRPRHAEWDKREQQQRGRGARRRTRAQQRQQACVEAPHLCDDVWDVGCGVRQKDRQLDGWHKWYRGRFLGQRGLAWHSCLLVNSWSAAARLRRRVSVRFWCGGHVPLTRPPHTSSHDSIHTCQPRSTTPRSAAASIHSCLLLHNFFGATSAAAVAALAAATPLPEATTVVAAAADVPEAVGSDRADNSVLTLLPPPPPPLPRPPPLVSESPVMLASPPSPPPPPRLPLPLSELGNM
eukprot:363820-Chlamydomonas_euryale.AAC.4